MSNTLRITVSRDATLKTLDIVDAKEFLSSWLNDIANRRIHGTIRKIPAELFAEVEKQKLKELPVEDFLFSKSSRANVYPNCHIAYDGNYYSVPYIYIGCDVDVIEVNNLLKVYFKGEEIALHPLCKDLKGEHITDNTHYPANKNITGKEILSRQQEEMKEIGENALAFFLAFCNKGVVQKYDYRTISGILALRSKYKNVIIDMACKRALYYNSITYGTVKKICEKGLIALPVEHNESFVNEDGTDIARDLSCYTQLSLLGVIDNE